jgi:hypothetical protein
VESEGHSDGLGPESDLIAPDDGHVLGADVFEADGDGVAHAGRGRLNGDVITAGDAAVELGGDFGGAGGREHEHKRGAEGFEPIQQPIEDRAAGHGIEDLGAMEA